MTVVCKWQGKQDNEIFIKTQTGIKDILLLYNTGRSWRDKS